MTLPTRQAPDLADLRDQLDYDTERGVFRWRHARRGVAAWSAAGSLEDDGYWSITFRRQHYPAHRIAWYHSTGEWPSEFIDHINGDRGDNRLANLRPASPAENARNRHAGVEGSKSPLLGAHWDGERNKWAARIKRDGRTRHLGRFDTDLEAHNAYMAERAKEGR